MTPTDKANELANKFVTKSIFHLTNEELKQERLNAKNDAIICVDELISAFKELSIEDSGTLFRDFGHGYWEEVKKEIELL